MGVTTDGDMCVVAVVYSQSLQLVRVWLAALEHADQVKAREEHTCDVAVVYD